MACGATDLETPAYQTVRFYYDGVRRIQEVVQGVGEDPDVTRAEYVYGPDYVDEFIVQTYNDGLGNQQPLFMLQDGNYNVVALLGQSGQVLEQYVWDPYGTPLIKDTSATPGPVNRVGHQGLFWHSLDGSATFNAPDPAATPTATGLYYNRNRWYAPHLGRFLQRDPNETGMFALGTLARNGEAFSTLLDSFQGLSHYGDGLNLFSAFGANPIHNTDPAGLSLEDDIDEAIAGIYGEHANVWVTLETATNKIENGNRLAMAYAAAAFLWDQLVWDQGEAALFDLTLGGFLASACFTGDTEVWMADGSLIPIKEVAVGDEVLSYDVDDSRLVKGRVVRTFHRNTENILRLQFENYVVNATIEHPFWVLHEGWTAAGELRPDSLVVALESGVQEIEAVDSSTIPENVYNIEIEDQHNYFVSTTGLLVHNQCNHGRFVNKIRQRGFGPPTPTRGEGGKMYKHPDGTRVRIHPRPNRKPYPKEPLEKFKEPFYYRTSDPAVNNGEWSAPTALPE